MPLAKEAAKYFFRTSFKRVLSLMIVLGVTLLGLSWVDLLSHLIQEVQSDDRVGVVTFAEWTGLGMIMVGFSGHLLLYGRETREKRKAADANDRDKGANVVGRLRVLVNGFREAGVARDSGYYNAEIDACQRAASDFVDVAPPELRADPVLASIASPKFDASKEKPYFDLEVDEIEGLIGKIEEHYGIANLGDPSG